MWLPGMWGSGGRGGGWREFGRTGNFLDGGRESSGVDGVRDDDVGVRARCVVLVRVGVTTWCACLSAVRANKKWDRHFRNSEPRSKTPPTAHSIARGA